MCIYIFKYALPLYKVHLLSYLLYSDQWGRNKVSYEPPHEISNNDINAASKASNQPAQFAHSDQSLCWSLNYYMTVKILIEHSPKARLGMLVHIAKSSLMYPEMLEVSPGSSYRTFS